MTKAYVFSLKSDSSRPRHCEIVTERKREKEGEREGGERGGEGEREDTRNQTPTSFHSSSARTKIHFYLYFLLRMKIDLAKAPRDKYFREYVCTQPSHDKRTHSIYYAHSAKRSKNPGTARPTQCACLCTLVEVLLFKLGKKKRKKTCGNLYALCVDGISLIPVG